MYPTIDNEKTGERIRIYMELGNLSAKDIQNSLNLASVQAVYHWINGRCLPSLENLYALSELFGVPLDMLVVGNRKRILKKMNLQHGGWLYTYGLRLYELA